VNNRFKGQVAVIAGCASIFWPGAFIFSFPGIMGPYWQKTFHVGRAAVGQTLFFVLAAVGLFMFFIGRWQEKTGPAWLAAIGAALCGASTMLLGYASSITHIYAWAFTVGASSACIYIPALTVAQRWYPQRRGLASGTVNLVFALSAAFISPIYIQMLKHFAYSKITFIFGLLALICGLAAAPFVCFPPVRAFFSPDSPEKAGPAESGLTVSQCLVTKAFWFLWLTWALTGAAGISMIPLSTLFGLSKGLNVKEAVLILTAFNLTNGLSRLAAGYISDVIGRNITMSLAFLAAACAYFLMPNLDGLAIWAVLAATVGFAFGTLFAVSAPLASECFGLAHFGAIFGLIFTAYGFVAGPVGPWLSGLILDATQGNFKIVFSYLGIFCVASSIFIWFTRPSRKV
jgi:OFA family oxalate/formate antiporter-like MFS transporter